MGSNNTPTSTHLYADFPRANRAERIEALLPWNAKPTFARMS